jgi:hypothetical protein
VKITKRVSEEGLRPQTVRQLLLRAPAWAERPKENEAPRRAAETK